MLRRSMQRESANRSELDLTVVMVARSRNRCCRVSRQTVDRNINGVLFYRRTGQNLCFGLCMGDPGRDNAIRPAGETTELARRIGTYRPSESYRSRLPESCGKRPDEPDEVDAARAQEYALLAVVLARAPDAALLERITWLRGDGTPLGVAHSALVRAANEASAGSVAREFFDLFIGVGRGELLPYGSYYLT